ncbi:MAG: O-methyltransferase [Paludibacteraceae bacterium]|nr:O-methyltransferase [Paludibacteraceae bacterium]
MTLSEYIEQHSSPESTVLQQITRSTHLEVINPRMLSGHVQGRVLSMLSQMIRPKRILELGTFTGYSALCLAEGLTEDGKLITVEHNDELEDSIRRNLALSPLGEKIELVIGDAKEAMRRLGDKARDERREAKGAEVFDLVFIDADKKEYCDYLDLVLPLMRAGGWILADNTLWDGHIIEAAYDKDKQTVALRAFNDKVAQDERLEKVILPLRDGLTIIRVKELVN